jgi:hypothetical protein
MEAVDAAGPATPLSDPSFEGTVFIPDDVVRDNTELPESYVLCKC